MRYLAAILFPAIAFLSLGKYVQAILCLLFQFSLVLWGPAILWALFAVFSFEADKRNELLIQAVSNNNSR